MRKFDVSFWLLILGVHLFLSGIFIWALINIAIGTTNLKGYSNIDATVTRVYDGDTIFVDINNCPDVFCVDVGVRIHGIDTPEIRGKCEKEKALALKTRAFVSDLLPSGTRVLLLNVQRDKYFRILADVIINGKSISDLLIKNKLAVPYYGDTKTKDWCK